MKKIRNIAFILCLSLLAVFPLGVLVRINLIPNVNIYPQDIVAGLLFILLAIALFVEKKGNMYKQIFIGLLLFNLVASISLLININQLKSNELFVAFLYLIRFDVYVSLIFLGMFEFNKFQSMVIKRVFYLATLLTVAIGFVQYFLYNNLRNLYYLGWDEHLYRLFSSYLDPNYAGLVFALFSILLIGNLIQKHEGWNGVRIIYLISLALTFVAMLLTFSRTALLAFVLGVGIILLSLKKIKLAFVSLVILAIGVLFVSDFSVEGLNPLRIASSEARVESMRNALVIISENMIFGVGFNAYRYAQINKGFRIDNPEILSNADAGTDNSLLFVLATTGIVGFAAYVFFWFQIVRKIAGLNDKFKRVVFFALIASLFLGSQFINALFYMPLMLWIFFYLGMFGIENGKS